MLRTIPLKNKPLCLINPGEDTYIGDARGIIYFMPAPYTRPHIVHKAAGPVPALAFHKQLYFGTWDGEVSTGSVSKRLAKDTVKCLAVFKDRIFASAGGKLFVLSQELEILEEIETESKSTAWMYELNRSILGWHPGLRPHVPEPIVPQ